jgi:hypothetical protein
LGIALAYNVGSSLLAASQMYFLSCLSPAHYELFRRECFWGFLRCRKHRAWWRSGTCLSATRSGCPRAPEIFLRYGGLEFSYAMAIAVAELLPGGQSAAISKE